MAGLCKGGNEPPGSLKAVNRVNDAIDKLNKDNDSMIVTWTKKFHLNINPGKTQAIILGHKRQTDAVKHLDISPVKDISPYIDAASSEDKAALEKVLQEMYEQTACFLVPSRHTETRGLTQTDFAGTLRDGTVKSNVPGSKLKWHEVVVRKNVFRDCVKHVAMERCHIAQLHDGLKRSGRALLHRYQREGDYYLGRIVAMDETWTRSYEPNLKRQSNEWKHPGSPRPKKVRPTQSAVKEMFIVACDTDG
ncbi:hypothetical protein ANN_07305 [Periplaneta americana]|uniref:Uncharacterized protein n=1 Tax=Periplaneta americana TaxID=6978 RepID=A0ABQ8TGJ5_PERAM|nr:hypothetical protein ANN_07305 [Periplaneta americana]